MLVTVCSGEKYILYALKMLWYTNSKLGTF